ncbi:hypothetical protein [Microbispora sp. NPDC049633]
MIAEASMTEARMTETMRMSPPAPQVAARPAAPSGILVIAQIHRVSEDM